MRQKEVSLLQKEKDLIETQERMELDLEKTDKDSLENVEQKEVIKYSEKINQSIDKRSKCD